MATFIKSFPPGSATWIKSASGLSGQDISLNGQSGSVTYSVRYKGDYALYYLNSYGGWDSFLIEGNVTRTDNATNYTYDSYVNNATIGFETNKYAVHISPSYTCYTSWLNDEQAANFAKNLLTTTQAYLHNLNSGEIIPVTVDATSASYKTYKNNGKKLVNYSFTVTESQSKLRR